ncbi:MAG: hypothetical protein N3A66_03585 [Planctomycetota bacterium]|nr:hypothetical protein [Planctomycetota bacterium]
MTGNQRPITSDGKATRQRPVRKRSLVGPVICFAFVVAAIALAPTIYERYRSVTEENRRRAALREQPAETKWVVKEEKQDAVPAGAPAERGKEEGIGALPREPREVAKAAAPSDDYLKLIEQAKAAFAEANFSAASDFYAQAAAKSAPSDRIAQAKEGAAACRLFAEITEGVKTSVEAEETGVYLVKLKNAGPAFRAKVTVVGDEVKIQKDGITSRHQRNEIESMEPVSAEQRTKEMRDKLTADRLKAERDGLSYYLLAVQALQYGFKKEAAELLKEAYELDKAAGKDLRQTVKEYRAGKLFKEGAWFFSVAMPERGRKRFDDLIAKYPDTKAAALAQEILREQEFAELSKKAAARQPEAVKKEAPPKAEEPKSSKTAKTKKSQPKQEEEDLSHTGERNLAGDVDGVDKESLQKANQSFRQGMELVKEGQSTPSAKKSNECYKQAQRLFEEAAKYYETALKKDPKNTDLENRLQECMMQLFWSKRLQRLM